MMEYISADFSLMPTVINFGIEHLKNGVMHKSRTASEYIFYYIISGSLHLVDNSKPVTLTSGDVYFFNKAEYHFPTCYSECRYIFIHFTSEFKCFEATAEEMKLAEIHNKTLLSNITNENYEKTVNLPKHYSITKESVKKKIMQYCYEAVDKIHNKNDFYKIFASTFATNILIEVYGSYIADYIQTNTKKSQMLAKNVIEYINKNYSESIDSKILESKFEYSIDYINRCFKEYTDKTVFAYLREVRLKRAAQLRQMTAKSVTDIAAECGFNDVFHFSKLFKKYYGITPKDYK